MKVWAKFMRLTEANVHVRSRMLFINQKTWLNKRHFNGDDCQLKHEAD